MFIYVYMTISYKILGPNFNGSFGTVGHRALPLPASPVLHLHLRLHIARLAVTSSCVQDARSEVKDTSSVAEQRSAIDPNDAQAGDTAFNTLGPVAGSTSKIPATALKWAVMEIRFRPIVCDQDRLLEGLRAQSSQQLSHEVHSRMEDRERRVGLLHRQLWRGKSDKTDKTMLGFAVIHT